MTHVPVTSTRHLLSFSALSPLDFERVCLGLLSRRPGYTDLEHLGAAGKEQGRDIVLTRLVGRRSELVYVQCKRVQSRPNRKLLLDEVAKVGNGVARGDFPSPDVLLFMVSWNLSDGLRSVIQSACSAAGLRAEFLGLSELDDEVHRHPELLNRFFGLPGGMGPTPPASTMPFDRVTPRHLGYWQRDFVNRVADLESLEQAQSSVADTPRVLVLSGAHGTGKSRLANEWAQRQKAGFPDGQLVLDLRTMRQTPAGVVADSLRASLEALGCPPKRVPEKLAERQALYRTVTSRSRMMIVIDHAEEPGEVRALLPDAPESVVVVTSNSEMPLLLAEGAVGIPVSIFDPGHDRRLLESLVGFPAQGAVAEVAEARILSFCGGLPLAIELCASRVRDEGGSYEWLAGELVDENTRPARMGTPANSIDVVMHTAYAGLPADLARAYRLIGLGPRLNSWRQIATVLGLDQRVAQTVIHRLRGCHLIEVHRADDPGAGSDRFDVGMHDLVRLHARSVGLRDSPEEAAQMVERAISYAVLRAGQLDRAISPDRLRIDLALPAVTNFAEHRENPPAVEDDSPASGADAARMFAMERPFILWALAQAEQAGRDGEACVIADSLWPVMYGRGYSREIASVFEIAIESANRLGIPRVQCRLNMLLARGLGLRDDYEQALARADLAIDLAHAEADGWLLGSALEVKGILLLDTQGPAAALKIFRDSRRQFPVEQQRGQAIQDLHIGMCLAELGRIDEAIDSFSRALEAVEVLGDHVLIARVGWRYASALIGGGRSADAAAVALRAEGEAAVAGEYAAQGRALMVLAELSEDPPERRVRLRAALAAFAEAADAALVAEVQGLLNSGT